MSEPTITERLAAARRRAWDALEAARKAAQEERDLELEEATQHARAKLDEALTGSELSPKLHGELVASAAREHGAASARADSIHYVTWRHLRVALASLVERVQVAERERDEARRERDEAQLAVEQALGGGMEALEDQLAAAEEALGRGWLAGGVSLAEGIRRKTARLEALSKSPSGDLLHEERARADRAEAMLASILGPRVTLAAADRELLGREVRRVWVEWAREQPAPKASWLVPWEGLSEPDREVDRRIGETLVSTPRRERDEARAQLAALREAVMTLEWGTAARACSDLAASAREHETRIRAKALREAADVCEREATDCSTATGSYIAGRCEAKLRALADEAERGTR